MCVCVRAIINLIRRNAFVSHGIYNWYLLLPDTTHTSHGQNTCPNIQPNEDRVVQDVSRLFLEFDYF